MSRCVEGAVGYQCNLKVEGEIRQDDHEMEYESRGHVTSPVI